MERSFLTLHTNASVVVLFVGEHRLELFGSGSLSHVIALDIPLDLVKDVDVVNAEGYDDLIEEWLTRSAVPTADAVIVLSEPLYFTRDTPTSQADTLEKELQEFTDTVPFERVITKQYPQEHGVRFTATNEALIEALRHALLGHDLIVVAVVPSFLLEVHSGKRALDDEMGKFVISHADKLKSLSMVAPQPHVSGTGRSEVTEFAKKNKRLVKLLGVFMLLIVALMLLLFFRG